MSKFIEIRFGQGEWGNVGLVQKEIIPIDKIVDVYVCLPEQKSIQISYEFHGDIFTRLEFFKDQIDCQKRYCFIKSALDADADVGLRHGFLPCEEDDDDTE